jgi:hypothetical protein
MEGNQGLTLPILGFILSSEPGDAFVSVRYRNSYFWIDDRDLRSKIVFSFLMLVFNMVETGDKAMAPVVTIPKN